MIKKLIPGNSKNLSRIKRLIVNQHKNFCNQNKSDSRYTYEYESPEQQNVNFKTIGFRLFKYIAITGAFVGLTYVLFFRKYNSLAKRYQPYFISEYCELKLSKYASNKLRTIFNNNIYKSDSDEAKLVLKIYQNLLEKNKIKLQISQENIFVIDTTSYGAFICKNGDLFISSRILELANFNEDEISLFISVEIASNMMDKFSSKVFAYFLYEYILQGHWSTKMRLRNFTSHNIDKFNKFNRFLYFYPESCVSTYYEEADLLKQAILIMKKADYNIFQAIEVLKKFEDRMKYYPRTYDEVLFINRESRFYETAKNMLKIYLI